MEKESTFIGTLQRDFPLAIVLPKGRWNKADYRGEREVDTSRLCCEEIRKDKWKMALEWQD